MNKFQESSDRIQNPKSEIQNQPIGIFDSGVGGLSVYRALHNRLPNEHFVYLGDTARVPYGTKSLATVERYALENATFLASKGIKMLVVACNTASALALPKIREQIGLEVVGVIGPGGRFAVKTLQEKFSNKTPKIGVIATEATVSSNAYLESIKRVAPEAEVIQTACPLFVSLAEEGWAESDEARSIARKYLQEIVEAKVDALVLGCTHYPILSKIIQEAVGNEVILIDSGAATAFEVENLLNEKILANLTFSASTARSLGDDLDHFYVTDAADRFAKVAERFLGAKPRKLEAIEVFGQDRLQAN